MGNILESSFDSILDNYGNSVTEFKYTYMCSDERKTSTSILPLRSNELTQRIVDAAIDEAEEHIKQRRKD